MQLEAETRRGGAADERWEAPTALLVAVMLVSAALFRGGNRPLPLMALELVALLLLLLVATRSDRFAAVPRGLLFTLTALGLVALVQLVPLPYEIWARLPGRTGYALALQEVGISPAWMMLSIVPSATEGALLALLPPMTVLIAVIGLRDSRLRALVWVFLTVAVFQAVIGLMQYGGGAESLLRFGNDFYPDSAIGTYANRSHLAGLLVMALPIVLALLASSLFRMDPTGSRRRDGWFGPQANAAALYTAMGIALLLGVVFARSRTGIAIGMVGLLSTALVLGRNFGGRFSLHMLGAITALGALVAITIGLTPVLARFALDAMDDGRWPILDATLQAARDFFPLGSGAGTYAEVMRGYHPPQLAGEYFINHAHNDYAEWLVEAGLPALVLVLAACVLYARRWGALWAVRSWDTLHMMRVGAGVGMLLLALFGLTDYNLRIPANQIYFAFLAAVFFHDGATRRVAAESRPRRGEAGRHSPSRRRGRSDPAHAARPAAAGSASPEGDNPFA